MYSKNYFIANKIPFVLCASTGIAASLIGRRTVHSSFGIFLKDENIFCSLDIPKPNGYSMSYVSFIIIDETTMISAKVLNSIDYESRKLMKQKNDINSSKSSGGKNILLFGDMAQVPAVTKSNDDYLKAIAQFNQSDEFGGFIRWELNTIMRQDPNELDFIALLNYIRYHNDYEKIDERIEEISETRFIEKNIDEIIDQIDEFVGHDDKDGMIIITFTNKIANYHNLLILKKRNPENIFYFNAEFFIIFTYSYFANKNDNYNIFISKQQNLSKLYSASDGEKRKLTGAMKKGYVNCIVPFVINIAPGSRVMLLKNIDISIGLINGARGTFIRYIQEIDRMEIKFDFKKESANPILISRKVCVTYDLSDGKVIITYQFPIKLSWAITAHKSQGQTLEKVAINIGEHAFAHGSFYVALSRVKSLDNVVLFDLEKWPEHKNLFHMNPHIQFEVQNGGNVLDSLKINKLTNF